MTSIVERLISIIAPHRCIVCSTEGGLLCAGCLHDALQQPVSACPLCDRITKDFAVCQRCRTQTQLKHIWLASSYEGAVALLIQRFKFQHAQAAATPLGQGLVQVLPYLAPETLIVPIPTAPLHVRVRGYDHTRLLAREVARSTALRTTPLLRRNHNLRQLGAGRRVRQTQARDAFRLNTRHDLKGASILLVDDVLTTGATLLAAAKLLHTAGAARIDAVVVAKQQLPK